MHLLLNILVAVMSPEQRDVWSCEQRYSDLRRARARRAARDPLDNCRGVFGKKTENIRRVHHAWHRTPAGWKVIAGMSASDEAK
jgi:hypothetical protein